MVSRNLLDPKFTTAQQKPAFTTLGLAQKKQPLPGEGAAPATQLHALNEQLNKIKSRESAQYQSVGITVNAQHRPTTVDPTLKRRALIEVQKLTTAAH